MKKLEHLIETHSQSEPFLMHQTHFELFQPGIVYDPDMTEPYVQSYPEQSNDEWNLETKNSVSASK